MGDQIVKDRVRQFYDQVGWQKVADGIYQNARYEDLRPVAHEYIHNCHLRVNRYLKPDGKYLLDAGCGPIQYPEYLTYSQDYAYRACLDISIVALQEARQRIGDHGLFVVGDVANLPFKKDTFGGVVSLHTLHHLPSADQEKAYQEIQRTLMPGRTAVLVNGWTDSVLMGRMDWLVNLMEWVGRQAARLRGKDNQKTAKASAKPEQKQNDPTGTFIQKLDAGWLRQILADRMDVEINCWRSVNVRFLRAVFHEALGGRFWLRLLFRLEEQYPHYFGEKGQYPLIVVRKRA